MGFRTRAGFPATMVLGGTSLCYNAACANDRLFSDGDATQERCARTNRSAPFDQSFLNDPIRFGLQLPGRASCPGIAVVDESYPVPDEHLRLDGDAFTDERMTGDLAAITHSCSFLNFDEGPNPSVVADLAAVEIYKCVNRHVAAELNVGGNALEIR